MSNINDSDLKVRPSMQKIDTVAMAKLEVARIVVDNLARACAYYEMSTNDPAASDVYFTRLTDEIKALNNLLNPQE